MYNFHERYAGYKRGVLYFIVYSTILFFITSTTFWNIKTLFYFPIGFALSGSVAIRLMFLQYKIEKGLNPNFWILNIVIDIVGYFVFTYALFSLINGDFLPFVLRVEKVLTWLMLLSILVLGINIVVLLPLALFPATRTWACKGFLISFYVFGLTGWLLGLLWTWYLWGGVAVIIGLFIFLVGVVPIAMLATLFNGMWLELGLLALAVILTFGFRTLGMKLRENA